MLKKILKWTGLAAMDLLLIGISSIALGMRMLHRGRYLSR